MWGPIQNTNDKSKARMNAGYTPNPNMEDGGTSPDSKPAKSTRTLKDACANKTLDFHRFQQKCRQHEKAPRLTSFQAN